MRDKRPDKDRECPLLRELPEWAEFSVVPLAVTVAVDGGADDDDSSGPWVSLTTAKELKNILTLPPPQPLMKMPMRSHP